MKIAKTLVIQNCSLKFELTLSRLGIDAVFLMTLYRFLLPELTSKWHFPLSSSIVLSKFLPLEFPFGFTEHLMRGPLWPWSLDKLNVKMHA